MDVSSRAMLLRIDIVTINDHLLNIETSNLRGSYCGLNATQFMKGHRETESGYRGKHFPRFRRYSCPQWSSPVTDHCTTPPLELAQIHGFIGHPMPAHVLANERR